jgi:hypothetical protein
MPPPSSFAAPLESLPETETGAWPAPTELAAACRALWLATLGLMTAYMQLQGPAHRNRLARRIAANLATLSGQECFSADCRRRFSRLSGQWQARAAHYAAASDQPSSGTGRLKPA